MGARALARRWLAFTAVRIRHLAVLVSFYRALLKSATWSGFGERLVRMRGAKQVRRQYDLDEIL